MPVVPRCVVSDVTLSVSLLFAADGVIVSAPLELSENVAAPLKDVFSALTMSPMDMPAVMVTLAVLSIAPLGFLSEKLMAWPVVKPLASPDDRPVVRMEGVED